MKDWLQAEQADQQLGFVLVVPPQVEQMTQHIRSFLGNRLRVEEVAQLPGMVIGVAVPDVALARSVR